VTFLPQTFASLPPSDLLIRNIGEGAALSLRARDLVEGEEVAARSAASPHPGLSVE